MLGSTVADISLVFVLGEVDWHYLIVLIVYEQATSLVNACIFIAVELTYLATFFNTEVVFATTNSTSAIEFNVRSPIDVARKLGHLGGAVRVVDASGPSERLLVEYVEVCRKLDTGVLGSTNVNENSVVDKWRLRSCVVPEQVL